MSEVRTVVGLRQAITTKYIGPTNTRGARVKAKAAAGSITVEWQHCLGSEDNHAAAAKALADKLGWRGSWYGGGMPDNRGYVWVDCEHSISPHFTTNGT